MGKQLERSTRKSAGNCELRCGCHDLRVCNLMSLLDDRGTCANPGDRAMSAVLSPEKSRLQVKTSSKYSQAVPVEVSAPVDALPASVRLSGGCEGGSKLVSCTEICSKTGHKGLQEFHLPNNERDYVQSTPAKLARATNCATSPGFDYSPVESPQDCSMSKGKINFSVSSMNPISYHAFLPEVLPHCMTALVLFCRTISLLWVYHHLLVML